MGKDHGPSIKDDEQYEALRREGESKEKAARIANTSRSSSSKKGGKSGSYEDWSKDDLQKRAGEIGIEGRSKMNKRELVRAVEQARGTTTARSEGQRDSRAKANPIEVQKFLEGVGYPTRKPALVQEAKRQGASEEVRETLERLPDEEFETPTDVSEAIGKLS